MARLIALFPIIAIAAFAFFAGMAGRDPASMRRRWADRKAARTPEETDMDDPSRSPNPVRLQRNLDNKVLAGVCSGLADYLNLDVALVRVIAVASAFFALPFVLVGYVVAAIIIPPRRHPRPELSPDEEQFWRSVSRRPEATFSNLKYTLRDLEERLEDMERVVTSEEWTLRREFNRMERDDQARGPQSEGAT